jgi:uncharacterized protein (TIGR02285 family)
MRSISLAHLGGLLAALIGPGLLMPATAIARERPVITWAVVELPPISIFKTSNPTRLKDLDNGSTDITTRAIAAQLSDYEHKVLSVSTTRIITDMSAGKPLCLGAVLPSPEIEHIAYLTPRGITPPAHLIVRKSDQQRITQGAVAVSLTSLLADEKLTGLIDARRPQGKGIDELITKPQKQLKKAQFTHFTAQYSSLLNSVDTGESDYTIELPFVMEYYNRKKVLANELVAIPLIEASTPHTVHVACTKSPWGAKVIREMDSAIRAAIKDDRSMRSALLHWLPENLQTEYAPLLDAYFKKRLSDAPPAPE